MQLRRGPRACDGEDQLSLGFRRWELPEGTSTIPLTEDNADS